VPPLRLRAIAGWRRGQEFVFSGPRVRIGRSRDNDFILPERETPASSGHHAEAVLDSSGAWWIIDLGSSNGTRVNDLVVQRHDLHSGDRITFGDEQFAVRLGGRSRAAIGVFMGLTAVVAGLAVAVMVEQGRASSSFEAVAASAARSVFMLAVDENGTRSLVGTAFAVDTSGTLATNAHIAAALQRRLAPDGRAGSARVIAVQSDTSNARLVTATSIHPGWQGSILADVALLRLQAGEPLAPLALADAARTANLRRGTPLATLGFPAVSTDPLYPRGRLSVDVVGDVRDDYIQAGLGITPGMSGSPVFDQTGAVVAIVAGGDFVGTSDGARPSGSAANWAISVRLLRELLASTRRVSGERTP
jgi:S1-C subfamily serine protease